MLESTAQNILKVGGVFMFLLCTYCLSHNLCNLLKTEMKTLPKLERSLYK